MAAAALHKLGLFSFLTIYTYLHIILRHTLNLLSITTNNKHFEVIFPTLVGVSLLLSMTKPSISLNPLHHFSPNL